MNGNGKEDWRWVLMFVLWLRCYKYGGPRNVDLDELPRPGHIWSGRLQG